MRIISKGIFGITAGLLLSMQAMGADVRMTIEKPLISLMDRTILRIEFIDTQGKAVNFPDIEGLQIDYQGKQTSTRVTNGRSTTKIIHNYLITPSKAGDFTIGPVLCKYTDGEKSLTAQVRVIKPDNDPKALEMSKKMFSRITTDRVSPFVHEPFKLDLKVYVADGEQIDGNFSLRGGMPETGMEGELKWNVADKTREVIDGIIFNVYTLQTTAKTLTAGTFRFQPEVLLNVVIPRQDRRPYGFDDPFFGDFFGRQETRPIVLDCNTLEVTVQPVPTERRPESFSGGVGVFDFDVEVGPETVKAGDPVTVRMKITGKGNIKQIMPPTIEAGHDLKLYEARTLPSQGRDQVVFEQVVIPASESVTNIPVITFSYFNTATTDFRTLTKGPFPITVESRPQRAAQVIATVPSTIQRKTEILGRDIVYLKTIPQRWKESSHTSWYQTRLFNLLLVVPLLLLIIVAVITTRRNRLAGDVALARRQKAPKAARQNLQRAEQAMRNGDETLFFEALWNALIDYFGHRLNLSPGEVTLETVLIHFAEEREIIEPLFREIEQRRYGFTPADGADHDMKFLLRQVSTALRTCERKKI